MFLEELAKAKMKWEEKLVNYEYQLSITASVENKFELRERIEECQREIERIDKIIESLQEKSQFSKKYQESENYESVFFFNSQSLCSISTKEEYDYRKNLLTQIKTTWIKNVLKDSLHNRVFIELGWKHELDLVKDTFCKLNTVSIKQNFTEGKNVIDIFKEIEVERTLLILGEPGHGKTITLLKLAEILVSNIKDNISQEIPVVLNLSSWQNKRQNINIINWLIQELNKRYKIKKYLAKKWIQEENLIFLLDGLDEVKAEYRETCVEAINRFRDEHGVTKIVICSRINDYKNFSSRLEVEAAICIKPLSFEQINWYFDKAGDQLDGLKFLLKNNPSLYKLSKSPLMLNIMILAYRGLTIDEIAQAQRKIKVVNLEEKCKKNLFDAYIRRMLEGIRLKSYSKLSFEQLYPSKKSFSWLTWLASIMMKESQKIFYIEEIQPSYLSNIYQKNLYRLILSVAISFIYLFCVDLVYIIITCLIALITKQSVSYDWSDFSYNMRSITTGFFISLCIIIKDLVDQNDIVLPSPKIGYWSKKKAKAAFLKARISGFYLGNIFSFISGLLVLIELAFQIKILQHNQTFEVLFTNHEITESFFILLFFGITFLFVIKMLMFFQIIPSQINENKFAFIDLLYKNHVLVFIICFVFLFYISPLLNRNLFNVLLTSLYYYLSFILILPFSFSTLFGVLGLIFGGWTRTKIQKTIYPNQGIVVLAVKTTILYIISSLIIGLVLGIIYHLNHGNPLGIIDNEPDGLFYGLLVGLLYGTLLSLIFGVACIKHFVLRIILYRNKSIPWNYADFLDYANRRGILQKVNGGYQFVHRELMEYFANRNDVLETVRFPYD